MLEPLFLCATIVISLFPLDVEHPSVFLDDESTLHNIKLDDCEDFLLDSPSLSPIAAPCDISMEETSPQEFALPESGKDPHLLVPDQIDHTSSNRWFDYSIIGMFCRLFRYILFELYQFLSEFSPNHREDNRSVSEKMGSTGESSQESFPSRQFDFDSCLLSLYSSEFISHSIQSAEDTVLRHTAVGTFLPRFTDPSSMDFPSQVYFASLNQTRIDILDSTVSEEEHRLLALLHRFSDPIHDAPELCNIGLPSFIHPVAEAYSFVKSMKARLRVSSETISEVFFADDLELESIQIPEGIHFQYTKLKDLKKWLNLSSQMERPARRYDAFVSTLRLLDVFDIDDELCKHSSMHLRSKGKEEISEGNCKIDGSMSDKLTSASKLSKLAKECAYRYGPSVGPESRSVGVFMAPASQNSLLFSAVKSFHGNMGKRRFVNSTAGMSFYAQEYYWLDDHHLGLKSTECRRKYLFHIPENRQVSIIFSCPVAFRG